MNAIVVYKTKYGSTKTYAEWIAEALDCEAVEMNGAQVKLVEILKPNFKITTVEDLQVAGALLK